MTTKEIAEALAQSLQATRQRLSEPVRVIVQEPFALLTLGTSAAYNGATLLAILEQITVAFVKTLPDRQQREILRGYEQRDCLYGLESGTISLEN